MLLGVWHYDSWKYASGVKSSIRNLISANARQTVSTDPRLTESFSATEKHPRLQTTVQRRGRGGGREQDKNGGGREERKAILASPWEEGKERESATMASTRCSLLNPAATQVYITERVKSGQRHKEKA